MRREAKLTHRPISTVRGHETGVVGGTAGVRFDIKSIQRTVRKRRSGDERGGGERRGRKKENRVFFCRVSRGRELAPRELQPPSDASARVSLTRRRLQRARINEEGGCREKKEGEKIRGVSGTSCNGERSRGFSPTHLDTSARVGFCGALGGRNSAESQLAKRAAQLAEPRWQL